VFLWTAKEFWRLAVVAAISCAILSVGARPENIVGIELLPERIVEAVELCPKAISIHQGNAASCNFRTRALTSFYNQPFSLLFLTQV
jgi:hypothetical protein